MSTKAKLTLKRNKKHDKIYDATTGLVIRSTKDKVVIGRLVDDEYIPLNAEMVELCDELGYEYDESLLASEPTNESEEESEREASSSQEASQETTPVQQEASQEAKREIPEVNNTIVFSRPTPEVQLSYILEQHKNALYEFVNSLGANSELESTLASVRVELEETQKELLATKTKLKKILIAMQGDL